MSPLSKWELDEQEYSDASVQEYVDSIDYAFWYQYMSMKYRMIGQYELPAEAVVMDVGCGPCVYSALFLPYSMPSATRYLGVDLSLGMLREGRRQMGMSSVKSYFAQSLTSALPIESHSVGVCIVVGLIHHLPPDQHRDVLREVARVLHPRGLVLMHEPKVEFFEAGPSPHERGLDSSQLLKDLKGSGLQVVHYSEHHVPLLYKIMNRLQLTKLKPGLGANTIWWLISLIDVSLVRLGASGADMSVIARYAMKPDALRA